VEPERLEADSDVRAMVDGVVSVTPLSLDITSRVDLATIAALLGQASGPGEPPAEAPAAARAAPPGKDA
jgi:hypothetical protein